MAGLRANKKTKNASKRGYLYIVQQKVDNSGRVQIKES